MARNHCIVYHLWLYIEVIHEWFNSRAIKYVQGNFRCVHHLRSDLGYRRDPNYLAYISALKLLSPILRGHLYIGLRPRPHGPKLRLLITMYMLRTTYETGLRLLPNRRSSEHQLLHKAVSSSTPDKIYFASGYWKIEPSRCFYTSMFAARIKAASTDPLE